MIDARLSSLKSTRPHEFALRFVFGGLCTVAAGLVARYFGPVIGGLFLAFPAIFPAGASLIDSHERRRKRNAGFEGTVRGRAAASVDAAGASAGSVGLAGFACILWVGLGRHSALAVQAGACVVWIILAGTFWLLRKGRLLRSIRSLLGVYRPNAFGAFTRPR